MLNLLKMVDDAVLAARQLELLLHGDVLNRIPIHLFTDSESTLESVASSKQISTKTLRNVIFDLKETLTKDEISSYSWLPTHSMWADILTKEKKVPLELEDVLTKKKMDLGDTLKDKVMAFGQEVRMTNIRNRNNLSSSFVS